MRYDCRIFVSVFLILLSLLILSACHGGTTEPEEKPLLSSLSEEECRQVLADYGVTIPEKFSDTTIKSMFAQFEEDPDMAIVLGWTDLANFSEEVRAVVKAYYGLDTESQQTE